MSDHETGTPTAIANLRRRGRVRIYSRLPTLHPSNRAYIVRVLQLAASNLGYSIQEISDHLCGDFRAPRKRELEIARAAMGEATAHVSNSADVRLYAAELVASGWLP